MQDKILITGYNGALAQRLRSFLLNDYELIFLTSNKKSVDNHHDQPRRPPHTNPRARTGACTPGAPRAKPLRTAEAG